MGEGGRLKLTAPEQHRKHEGVTSGEKGQSTDGITYAHLYICDNTRNIVRKTSFDSTCGMKKTLWVVVDHK